MKISILIAVILSTAFAAAQHGESFDREKVKISRERVHFLRTKLADKKASQAEKDELLLQIANIVVGE